MSLPSPPQPDSSRTALFLDIDGTLAEFKRRPDEVGPTPRLTALLHGLRRRLDERVAVISGRALADMDRITAGAVIAASGVHGLEHRDAKGRLETSPPHPELARARAEFTALVHAHPTLLLEDKGLGLVLHYRTAPELAGLANAVARRMVDETGLALQKGDMMAEVRTPGRNKGDALKTFMAEPPFKGAEPVFVGDDLTDESAFEAARELGGCGVLVGPQRETAASFRLDNVAAVLGWLEAFVAPASQARAI